MLGGSDLKSSGYRLLVQYKHRATTNRAPHRTTATVTNKSAASENSYSRLKRNPRVLKQQQDLRLGEPAADHREETELNCSHFASCSGCERNNGLSQPPIASAAARLFHDDFNISSFNLHAGPHTGWRMRCRLAVRGSPQNPKIGLFQAGSHFVEPIPLCRIQHPRLNEAVEVIRAACAGLGIQPYNERTGTGELRYVQLTAAGRDGERPRAETDSFAQVQAVLVWNSEMSNPGRLNQLASRIRQDFGRSEKHSLLHSIWANFNTSRVNSILGQQWELLHGQRHLWQHLGGADICFGPGSFAQANFGAMDACLRALQSWVPLGATVAELHSGVGTIGLSLAATREPEWVRFVEINPAAEAPFQAARRRLQGSGSGSGGTAPPMEFHTAAAGSDPGRWLSGAQVVVVDPPRKGLETSLLDYLCGPSNRAEGTGDESSAGKLAQHPSLGTYNESSLGLGPPTPLLTGGAGSGNHAAGVKELGGDWGKGGQGSEVVLGNRPHRLIYMSCGFPAFVQDCRKLLASGSWKLVHAEGFSFFPGTDTVEILAVFDCAA